MADRPIIFSAPMVRALLNGRKTQTRRILRDKVPDAPAMDAIAPNNTARHLAPYLDAYCSQPRTAANQRGMSDRWCWWTRDDRPGRTFKVPYVPGDRLYVREAWSHDGPDIETVRSRYEDALGGGVGYGPYYRATETAPDTLSWRPSIHMPRWASRLTLLVSEVRVQRLLDISEQDAEAEGVCDFAEEGHGAESFKGLHGADRAALVCSVYGSHRNAFRHLWEVLNGSTAWDTNPWVAAVSFTVHRANINAPDIGAAA